jgi:hypothetical protein
MFKRKITTCTLSTRNRSSENVSCLYSEGMKWRHIPNVLSLLVPYLLHNNNTCNWKTLKWRSFYVVRSSEIRHTKGNKNEGKPVMYLSIHVWFNDWLSQTVFQHRETEEVEVDTRWIQIWLQNWTGNLIVTESYPTARFLHLTISNSAHYKQREWSWNTMNGHRGIESTQQQLKQHSTRVDREVQTALSLRYVGSS